MENLGVLLNGFFPELGSGMEGIELEGKCPSFGIGVVSLEDVTSGSIFPLLDGFADGRDLEEGKKGAFAGSRRPGNQD